MVHPRFLLAPLLALSFVVTATSAAQPPASVSAPSRPTVTVVGQVLDSSQGAIAGASVTLEGASRTMVATTGADGRFVIEAVAAGPYVLSVVAPGFDEAVRSLDLEQRPAEPITLHLVPARVRQDVVVSATRVVTPTSALPNTVTVIDRERLANRVAASDDLASVLEAAVPGFSPSLKKLTGRGETLRGREPLYTLNGVSQSTPLRDGSRDGHVIDLDFLERVEVVHGSNALQGIGATGGVVNMVTRQPHADGRWLNEARLALTTGDGFEGDGVGSKISWLTGRRVGRTSFVAGVALNHRGLLYDGNGAAIGLYPTQGDTMDSQARSLFANVAFDLDRAQRVQVMVTDFALERQGDFVAVPGDRAAGRVATTVAGDPRPLVGDPARNASRTATLEYRHRQLGAGEFVAQAYVQRFTALFEGGTFGTFFRLTPGGGPFLDQSEIESDKRGVKLIYDVPAPRLAGFRTTVGLDVTEDATAQVLARSGRQWVPRTTLREASPFVQVQRAVGRRLLVTGGLRAEFAQLAVGDYTTIAANNAVDVAGGRPGFRDVLPNVGAVYQLGRGWSAYASLAQGFTMPDAGRVLRDVRVPGVDVDQLLDVQPVVADNREVGLDYRRSGLRTHVAYYRSHSDLGTLLVADATRTFSVSRQPTRTEGVDVTVEVTPRDLFAVGSTYAWQRGQFDSNGDGVPDTDLDGLNIGPNRLNVYAMTQLGSRVSTRLQVSSLFAREFGGLAPRGGRFGGYTTADLLVAIDTSAGTLRVGTENLLNRQYVTYFSQVEPFAANDTYFAGPGRSFTVSLQRRF